MRQSNIGNDIIKLLAVFGDVMLLNILLLAFLLLFPDIIPHYFHQCTKITALVANFALIFSEYFFQPIIHWRKLLLEDQAIQILKLTICHVLLTFVFVRLLCDGGGFFKFMFIFGFTEYIFFLNLRLIERYVIRRYRLSGHNNRNIVFIGSDIANTMLYEELLSDPSTGYKVLGYYSNETIENCPDELSYLGDLNSLISQFEIDGAKIENIDEVFCNLSHDYSEEIISIMRYCDKHTIHFFYVPLMFDNYRLHLKPEMFGDFMLFTNHIEPLAKPINRIIKRTFDIAFSLIICACLLPFIPLIAILIKLQSPGPIFFKQDRTGMNGKVFKCYKFRSMHINKDSDMNQATIDDPRKFSFGNFMRKTNIDEFPQFFNVLSGCMSIVGPRPHMLYHTQQYRNLIDKYMVRHFCKPGITGWAQVTGFRGETKELWQMEERIKRDIWYIENWTFWLDIRIILLTAKSLIIHDKNAY
ncbi:MAG: undecaprenyl-phosphate glucose phosphotransferase [Prevotella sp.]|jgi:putative colanic acid biosynthesis UDP-glucose lipid carrier transferase|nr:undecaprenyl-phosphate glucose phosphotransferase [Prevotella sp.]MCI1282855.1 undecaprenyl-phosphate glucose phosphotransferase [Prevotella sp.]